MVKHAVRITCSSITDRHQLLSITNLDDLAVRATLPCAEIKSENVNKVFGTFKYVISGLPIDVIEQCSDCMEVQRT